MTRLIIDNDTSGLMTGMMTRVSSDNDTSGLMTRVSFDNDTSGLMTRVSSDNDKSGLMTRDHGASQHMTLATVCGWFMMWFVQNDVTLKVAETWPLALLFQIYP